MSDAKCTEILLTKQVGHDSLNVSKWSTKTSHADLQTLSRISIAFNIDIRKLIATRENNIDKYDRFNLKHILRRRLY